MNEREIVCQRTFGIPRDELFGYWTNPELLKQWWGPNGFTNSFSKFDLKPGGEWLFTMHAPNGIDYPNKCVFVSIDKPKQIVFDHLEPGHKFRATFSFEATGRQTLVTFRMLHDTAAECEKVKKYVIPANEENFDRLEALIADGRERGDPMDAEDFEGTLVLEKLAEVDALDLFFEMIDNDDFNSAAALMRTANVDEATIAIVVQKMKETDGEH